MTRFCKRLLAAALCAAVLCGWPLAADGLPALRAFAAEGTCGENLTWTLEDGVLTVSGTGDMTDCLPGKLTFAEWQTATSVVLENGVTHIGNWAFYSCVSMQSVSIPATVQSIGEHAFYNCARLQSVVLPEGVERIGKQAFFLCGSLQSVSLPDSLTDVEYGAFRGTGLTEVTLPKNIRTLGNDTFTDCHALRTVYYNVADCAVTPVEQPTGVFKTGNLRVILGASVRRMPSRLFACSKLQVYADTWDAFLNISMEYAVFSGNDRYDLYIQDTLADTCVLPDTVQTIGDYQFYNCKSIRSLTLPAQLRSIGRNAFAECTNLTTLTVLSTDIAEVGADAFWNVPITYFYFAGTEADFLRCPIPAKIIGGTLSHSRYTLYLQNRSVTDFVMPDGVTEIVNGQFRNMRLNSVTLPASVRSVGRDAFCGVTELQNVYYTGTLTDWCGIQFASTDANPLSAATTFWVGGKQISYLEIPQDVTGIGDFQFFGLPGFVAVKLPDSVKTIGYGAFSSESFRNLSYVHVPSGVETIRSSSFRNDVCICSDSTDSEAYRWAQERGAQFRLCENHAHTHDFAQTVITPATCTQNGKESYTCTVCGEHYDTTVPARGHTYAQTIEEPYCGQSGQRIFTCTACGSSYSETIPAPGKHVFDSTVTVPPTCGTAGEQTNTCVLCGYSYTQMIYATGQHTYEETDLVPATCGTNGQRQYTCRVCGYSYTRTIYATGQHTYDETDLVPATCGTNGQRQYTCRVCGYSYTQTTYATGQHSYTPWMTALEPTPDADGIRMRVCVVCRQTQTGAIPYVPPLTLSADTLTLIYRQTYTLTPSEAVQWRSTDENVVRVDDDGTVRAVGKGTAQVIAETADDGKTAACTVTVYYAWWQMLIRIALFGFLWY